EGRPEGLRCERHSHHVIATRTGESHALRCGLDNAAHKGEHRRQEVLGHRSRLLFKRRRDRRHSYKSATGPVPALILYWMLSRESINSALNSDLRAIHVLGLEPLRSPLDLEFHFRAFFQGPVPGHLDGRKVDKHILAAGPLNKTIALGGVKP